jgi:hypothetical protein
VVKGFNTGPASKVLTSNVNNITNGNSAQNLYEYVDIQREMGEFLPSEISAIINN